MQVYSLLDLNEFVRRVIALNFQQSLWVTAEIGQIGQSRGHFYLDLLQKGAAEQTPDVVAQAQAILWSKEYFRVRAELGKTLDEVLTEGLQVKLKVRVEFSERYGLRLMVEDIDPAFTFGQLELARREVIRQLQTLGLLKKNSALALPSVLQRIAVVSSDRAAGLQDFVQHLDHNIYGYRFDFQVFNTAMQGKNVETELPETLARIARQQPAFDCAVVIRGGGARLDLTAFDTLEVCKAVAAMPIPVLSGIGHDVDETVLDLSAHTALKTPTAVADFLVQHNFIFENSILLLAENIRQHSRNLLKINELDLSQRENQVRWSARERLRSASWQLDQHEKTLPILASQLVRQSARRLAEAEAICSAFDPETTLRRGFSLTFKNGKVVESAAEVAPGDELETRLREGRVRSKVV